MIFNTTYQLDKDLGELSQDEIYNTPEYYACSYQSVIRSPSCPAHLKRVLMEMPWSGRENYVQVRPQGFKRRMPDILGGAFHVDVNTQLVNGRMHVAKSLDEFRSMAVSFGDVVETEFIKDPFEFDIAKASPFAHSQFADAIAALNLPTVPAKPNQLAIYTSRDVHRVGKNIRFGRNRLIIVTVEQDEPLEAGAGDIRPSLRERGELP